MLVGATPTSSLVLGEIAICDGGCPPANKETTVMVDNISAPQASVDFRNRLETNSKKKKNQRRNPTPTGQPPVASHAFFHVKSRRFAVAMVWTCDLSPRAKPPLPLHHKLICVHMHFWFYSCYTTPSVNQFFEALNGFKFKTCQLQSFITFWDLQLSCGEFFHLRSFTKFEFQIWDIQIWISLTIWYQIKKSLKLQSFITSQDLQLWCW
jgi:hypothetical protein